MTNPRITSATAPVYYHRNGTEILKAIIPNLLFKSADTYIATSVDNVVYFTKNESHVRLYCAQNKTYELSIGIDNLWKKISHVPIFKKVSKSLIINEDYIASLARYGKKDISLLNGEELCIEEHLLDRILEGHIRA